MPVAVRFGVMFAGWSLGLFVIARFPWVQEYLLLPFAAVQQRLSGVLAGPAARNVLVDASCSGADVLALCASAIFAYPAPWTARIRGAAWVVAGVLGLNIVRLSTVSLVADRPRVFELLHVRVWPALLVLAGVAFVMLWIRRLRDEGDGLASVPPAMSRLFAYTTALVALYFVLVARLESTALLERSTALVAATAGHLLAIVGISATSSGSAVLTSHGSFLVTPGCVASPLIPVYLAAVITLTRGSRRLLGVVAAVPVFFALGVARLLVLALPASLLPAPQLAIHAFHQVLVGVAMAVGTAFWWGSRQDTPRAGARRVLLTLAVGTAVLLLVAPVWSMGITGGAATIQRLSGHAGHTFVDDQGAFAMLPTFQLVLFMSLCVGIRESLTGRRFLVGIASLAILQTGVSVIAGELSHHLGFAPFVGLVRAWGVVVPAALAWVSGRPLIAAPSRTRGVDRGPDLRPPVSWPIGAPGSTERS